MVADNGKMVSLLINEQNDFVSVEFDSSKVRDVFCLLMTWIKEGKGIRREEASKEVKQEV